MRILLDHNLPRQLKTLLPGHDVSTARDIGWEELQNGALLTRAEAAEFQCLLTGDQNIAYQQNIKDRKIAILVVNVTDRKVLVRPLEPVVEALGRLPAGGYSEVRLRVPALRGRPFSSR